MTLPGVVAVDEIDAHLHPSWQQLIGDWFVNRFPNMQFLVDHTQPDHLSCRAPRDYLAAAAARFRGATQARYWT